MLKIKRVYEKYDAGDGFRILVDRLWPRGVSKENAHIDLWLEEIAPTTDLRKWFNHDPEKWEDFKKRYKNELEKHKEALAEVKKIIDEHKNITFVYSAKDEKHNNALVLKQYLEKK